MNKAIDRLRQTRKNFIGLVESTSTEILNQIPDGFNNNIIWNFAHTLASQQILCYKLSQLPMHMDDNFIDAFKKGSKPNGNINDATVKEYKEKALALTDQLDLDYKDGKFKIFQPYETSYGIKLNNIEDAIDFVNIHESMHLGYAKALMRSINSQTIIWMN